MMHRIVVCDVSTSIVNIDTIDHLGTLSATDLLSLAAWVWLHGYSKMFDQSHNAGNRRPRCSQPQRTLTFLPRQAAATSPESRINKINGCVQLYASIHVRNALRLE